MTVQREEPRALLLRVARRAMLEHGLEPDFPHEAIAEANALSGALPGAAPGGAGSLAGSGADGVADLRSLIWCSIDNDDSLDLDQLTVAKALDDGRIRIMVAVADVSASVVPGSALDDHAGVNTTSIYTPPRNFPMLPDRLSTDLTSLNADADRLAMVVEMSVDAEGAITEDKVSRALVRNQAKLAYSSVGAWLEGRGPLPPAVAAVTGLADNLRLQDRAAQALKTRRHEQGALELETIEVRAQFDGDRVSGLAAQARDRAKELIEDFMIAANGTVARFLEAKRFPVMRRVVRSPERWQRIVDLAESLGADLPAEPDAPALNRFLLARRAADPARFPDLSLAVIKLMGRGEYAVSVPGQAVTGHFGLAVREYAHSTAPNRRYPDLITQRLLKAALAGAASPYPPEQLATLATHCTAQEDAAQKVERLLRKAAAACYFADRIGDEFDGIITGASPKGTWVRAFDPPIEGRVVQGDGDLDVGDKVRVRLVHTDPERGFIDFALSQHTPATQKRRD
jgi:VacB/RNase II family 3'-5' exoribonuclease